MSDRAPRRPRLLALLAALVAVLALVGCSQEGKLVQAPLPVDAVAVSFLPVNVGRLVSGPIINRSINVRFKIVTHVANACEAQHALLELRAFGSPATAYQISPLARYNADDKCVQLVQAEGDTAYILDVNGVFFGKTDSATTTDAEHYQIVITTAGAPPITFALDSLVTDLTPNTAEFDVRVEDRTTGAVVPGVTVAIDQLGAGGSATPLDSVLTGADGLATVTVPAPADTAGAPNLPYRARVTLGPTLRVVSMAAFPARFLRREKIVVRL